MRIIPILIVCSLLLLTSCLNIEEEPIIVINNTAEISAHIKNQKIYATALLSVYPQLLTTGNIPTRYEFSGDLAIYDTNNGNIIDINNFGGGGLAQVYTVSADTTGRDRFIIIASGSIEAYADIENDGDTSNDKLLISGDFYQEAQFLVSELVTMSPN